MCTLRVIIKGIFGVLWICILCLFSALILRLELLGLLDVYFLKISLKKLLTMLKSQISLVNYSAKKTLKLLIKKFSESMDFKQI